VRNLAGNADGARFALSRRIHLARSKPRGEPASTGYCLAQPGVSYVIFAPDGWALLAKAVDQSIETALKN